MNRRKFIKNTSVFGASLILGGLPIIVQACQWWPLYGVPGKFNPNDDFTGDDGDAPNPEKYTETDLEDVLDIQNNQLHFQGDRVTYGNNARLEATYKLCGDFTVQIDIDVDIEEAGSPAVMAWAGLLLRHYNGALIRNDYIYRVQNTAASGACIPNERDMLGVSDEGGDSECISFGGAGDCSKLKMWRSGDTTYCSYYRAGAWEWGGGTEMTFSHTYIGPVELQIVFKQGYNVNTKAGYDWVVDMDNLTITADKYIKNT